MLSSSSSPPPPPSSSSSSPPPSSSTSTTSTSTSTTYLDYAGATLPSPSMLSLIYEDILKLPLGNPHTQRSTSLMIDDVRIMILDYYGLNKNDYDVIFTSGATASCKLVAESFPFGTSGVFAYASNAHTSLLGMRAYASNAVSIPVDNLIQSSLEALDIIPNQSLKENDDYNLLAISGECNFSGAKVDFNAIHSKIKPGTDWLSKDISSNVVKCYSNETIISNDKNWLFFLDAAKLSSTSPVNFSGTPSSLLPHFIAISFYKIFGYPTGLGALLIRRDAARVLRKRYYGGGTVLAASADIDYTVPKFHNPHEHFEDGTSHFYGIIALKRGFDFIQGINGMSTVQTHTMALCKYTVKKMRSLIHQQSGKPLVEMYGRHLENIDDSRYNEIQGPIIAFNLFWSNGEVIGFSDVAKLAEKEGIVLRVGCFCNVGACSSALNLSPMDVQRNFSLGRTCEDTSVDIVDGRATGAIRVSFGYNSTMDDCSHLLRFLEMNFLNKSPKYFDMNSITFDVNCMLPSFDKSGVSSKTVHKNDNILLSDIYVYPIKSCGGMRVRRWPLSSTGLLLDREWAIVDSTSMVLTQKKFPSLSLLKVSIDLDKHHLTISYDKGSNNDYTSITIPIADSDDDDQQAVRVCGRHCNAGKSSLEVNQWFSDYLGIPCSLVRISNISKDNRNSDNRDGKDGKDGKISFANDAQFLIVSAESLMMLSSQVESLSHLSDERKYLHSVESIRPNFIVTGGSQQPHQEDYWSKIVIKKTDDNSIDLVINGPCPRCSMVNINNNTGKYESGILEAMSTYRTNIDRRIYFGQFASLGEECSNKIKKYKDEIHYVEIMSTIILI